MFLILGLKMTILPKSVYRSDLIIINLLESPSVTVDRLIQKSVKMCKP